MAGGRNKVAADGIRTGHDLLRRGGMNAGSGAQTTLTDAELDANQTAIEQVVKALGGRGSLLDALSVAADAPEVERIVALLVDPRYDGISLRRLCSMAGLTVVDLFAAYKKAMVVKAQLVAYQAITDHLLPVVVDVMKRAAPYKIPCYDCAGAGLVAGEKAGDPPVTCATCAGQKELLQLPDLDRQKLALELGQLVQKSAGINIQQNQLTVPPPEPDPAQGRGTLIELQHALAELQSAPRLPIIDATVVPAADPGDPT